MYKQLLYILLLVTLSRCNQPNRNQEIFEETKESWAELMANSVISRYDSLINYYSTDSRWLFDVAMLGQAIDKLGNKNQKYSEYMKDYIDHFVMDDGSIMGYNKEEYFLDEINPAKNLITLYKRTGEKKYYKAIQHIISQLKDQPKTSSGGFWHKSVYPNQMYINGTYMFAPFMAQYAREFNTPEWFDVATFQIIHMYDKTADPVTGLLYHAWDEDKKELWSSQETGHSKFFWGRGIGWFTMAIVDVLDYLPENHPEREKLISILNSICSSLLKYQDKNTGLWFQIINKGEMDDNYLEASCSGMFIYVFAKGAKKGYLPSKYLDIANNKFSSLINEFIVFEDDESIAMKNICGPTGLGGYPYRDGTYGYYVNNGTIDNDAKGIAPFIMAAFELNK